MTEQQLHWDGNRWLTWNGDAWVTADPQPAPPTGLPLERPAAVAEPVSTTKAATNVVSAFGCVGFIAVVIALVGVYLIWSAFAGPKGPDWTKFSPTVKARIDTAAAAKDCAGLQAEFNAASDSELLSYIDDKLRTAGCYG